MQIELQYDAVNEQQINPLYRLILIVDRNRVYWPVPGALDNITMTRLNPAALSGRL